MILVFITLSAALGFTLGGLAKELWQWYLAETLPMMRICLYSSVRAMLTRY